VSEDLFAKFDRVVKDLGSWLKSQGFEGKGRSFTLQYENGWRLLLGILKSHHNRRVDETFRFLVQGTLYDESETTRWEWQSSWDGPGKVRPYIDRSWQKLDPEVSREEFTTGLASAFDAVAKASPHWDILTYHSDPTEVVQRLKDAISESLLLAANLEVGGSVAPPLSGERF
jgi:hypothetical protein